MKYRGSFILRGILLIGTLLQASLLFLQVAHAQVVDAEDILWDDLSGTKVDYPSPGAGSTLQKTGSNGAYNADAISNKRIEGDGKVEFRFGAVGICAVGLTTINSGHDLATLPYAVQGDASTHVYKVFLSNVQVATGGYLASDFFQLQRNGVTVSFYKNGVPISTSPAPANSVGSLLVDTSFYTTGASITDCTYSGSAGLADIIWKNEFGTLLTYPAPGGTGSRVVKANSISAATACSAVSAGEIAGDGYLQVRLEQNNADLTVGFTTLNPAPGANTARPVTTFRYAFQTSSSSSNPGMLYAYEAGSLTALSTYLPNAALRIQRSGSTIRYYQNDVLLRETVAITDPLVVDTFFLTPGGAINNAQYSGVSTSENVVWSQAPVGVVTNSSISQLKRTSTPGNSWNAGAGSSKTLPGDGSLQWQFNAAPTGTESQYQSIVGLIAATTITAYPSISSLKFAVGAINSTTAAVYESGTAVTKDGQPVTTPFVATDALQIQRIGSTILYLKNGVPFYTSTVSSTGDLLAGANFYTTNTSVSYCRMNGTKVDVQWTSLHDTAPSYSAPGTGSTLTKKTAGAAPAEGASSVQLVGDGFFEFRFSLQDKEAKIGLRDSSPADSANDWGQMNLLLSNTWASNADRVQIYEFGSLQPENAGNSDSTKLFKFLRTGETLKIYANNGLLPIYTGKIPTADALWLDVSLTEDSAAIKDAQIYAPAQLEDVLWVDEFNASASYPTPNQGSKLDRNLQTGTAPAGANSSKVMAGDGRVQWHFGSTQGSPYKDATVGLATSRFGFTTADILYGVHCREDGVLEIIENGVVVAHQSNDNSDFDVASPIKIKRTGSTIEYYVSGGFPLWTTTGVSPEPLMVKACFTKNSGYVIRVQYYQFDGDHDGLDDAWEYKYFGDLNQTGASDFDGDGIANGEEYQTQGNPIDHPPAPTNLSAIGGIKKIMLDWTPVGMATSYTVKRSASSSGTYNSVATGLTASTFMDSALNDNATWYYIVSGSNRAGEGGYSSASATTAPAAPLGLKAVAGTARVALSWTASAGASKYKVLRSTASGTGYTDFLGNVVSIPLVTLNDTDLSNGVPYFYVVTAINEGALSSSYSAEISAIPMAAPTGLAAAPGNGKVTLTWNGSVGATGYKIKRSSNYGPYFDLTTVMASTSIVSFIDSLVTNGNLYSYLVIATNSNGASDPSTAASAKPMTPPAAPTGLSATAGNAQVTLKWTVSTGAASYNILQSTSASGPFDVVGTTTVGVVSFTKTGLANGTTYYYFVTATNVGGTSGNSNLASAIPLLPAIAPDLDNDNLADEWEIFYFMSLSRNGFGDFDLDGQIDLQEFYAGTDPTVSNLNPNDHASPVITLTLPMDAVPHL